MGEAKIRLSEAELELVTNAGWILTKNAILQKIKQHRAGLQEQQLAFLSQYAPRLPVVILSSSPKISKGENYNGLPYLLLDYPRIFERENILAIRTMFWWGQFFSTTLHLSGTYKNKAVQKIIASYEAIKQNGFYCGINDDPWKHHFEENNYRPLDKMNPAEFEKLMTNRPFIKLAAKIPLEQWEESGEILLGQFKQLIELVVD